MFKTYTVFTLLFFVSVIVKARDSVVPEIFCPYLDKPIASVKIHYPRLTGYNDKINLAKINVKKAEVSWKATLLRLLAYSK